MDAVWKNVTEYFTPTDSLPWTDAQSIEACERDLSDPGQASSKADNLVKLSWALVHSRRESDVRRGIAMLEDQLRSLGSVEQAREVVYLLAVGWFRTGDYARSRKFVDEALLANPNFYQAANLKRMIEKKIASDGVIGMGIAAGVAAVVVAGLTAAAGRR